MPAPKIQDRAEVIRWIEDGKTYDWMSQRYLEKYNIETHPTMFANFRRRNGIKRRIVRDEKLIPWEVNNPEHRHRYAIVMLRTEARRRAGEQLTPSDAERLDRWLETRRDTDTVVHYDPDTTKGFWYMPRRAGIDKDLIREPEMQVAGDTHKRVVK